jgi:dihydrofolate reductase
MSITLDGYITGANQSPAKPFGDGTEHLNDWLLGTASVRKLLFGQEGGDTGLSDAIFRERVQNIGAVVMGRNMFGGGPGPWGGKQWGDGRWDGWWGEEPPYHCPVFVLTHHAREPLPMKGGTTFYFITDGIESAMKKAKAVAGKQDVNVGGGAQAVQQALRAGLLDELELHLVPMLLGAGERLFDTVTGAHVKMEQIRVMEDKGVTHLKYRIAR